MNRVAYKVGLKNEVRSWIVTEADWVIEADAPYRYTVGWTTARLVEHLQSLGCRYVVAWALPVFAVNGKLDLTSRGCRKVQHDVARNCIRRLLGNRAGDGVIRPALPVEERLSTPF